VYPLSLLIVGENEKTSKYIPKEDKEKDNEIQVDSGFSALI
jgi:hypothetical protein